MTRFRAIVVPLVALCLIGSGSALAWSSVCCLEDAKQAASALQDMGQSHHADHGMAELGPSESKSHDAAMAGEPAMADCGMDEEATGMCCLGGVVGQPPITVTITLMPGAWLQPRAAHQTQQAVVGLYRPPKA